MLSGSNPRPLIFRGGPGHLGSVPRTSAMRSARSTVGMLKFTSTSFTLEAPERHTRLMYRSMTAPPPIRFDRLLDCCQKRVLSGRRSSASLTTPDLGTVLGRAFVGLVDDCGDLVVKIFVTNGQSRPLAAYLSKKGRPHPFFGVSPLIAGNRDRLVHVVEQAIRQWAGVP